MECLLDEFGVQGNLRKTLEMLICVYCVRRFLRFPTRVSLFTTLRFTFSM